MPARSYRKGWDYRELRLRTQMTGEEIDHLSSLRSAAALRAGIGGRKVRLHRLDNPFMSHDAWKVLLNAALRDTQRPPANAGTVATVVRTQN